MGHGNTHGPNQPKRPQRPIKRPCATRQQKVELFRISHRLKQDQTYVRVTVSSDITDEQMLAYKEVQMMHNAVGNIPNAVSKIKGNAKRKAMAKCTRENLLTAYPIL